MAQSIKCTLCRSVLKTARPIEPGRKVKCPKCAKIFVVAAENEEETEAAEISQEDETDNEPEANDDGETEAVKKKPKKKRAVADDDDEDRPKKKKKVKAKKSSAMFFVMIGVPALLLSCGICGGIGWYFRGTLSGPGGNVPEASKGARPDFKLTADALVKEFTGDKNAVAAKYKDKTLELTGEFGTVALNYLVFKTVYKDEADVRGVSVACSMIPEFLDKTGRLSKGQKIKVVGKFSEADFRVELSGCSLIELEPTKLSVTPADMLAQEFEKNATAASAKYKGQDVILSGPISDKGKNGPTSYVKLGRGKTRFRISLPARECNALKVGEQIEMRSTFNLFIALEGDDIPMSPGFGMVLRPKWLNILNFIPWSK